MDIKIPSNAFLIWIISMWFISSLNVCFGQGNRILEYIVYEEEGSNQFVANVKIDSDLSSRYPIDVITQLEFTFRYNTNLYQLFSIGNKNGIIRTRQTIDRDEICEHQITCDIELDITIRPVQYFEIIKVMIHIEDINDNAPQFPQSHITRSISESTMPQALIPIPSAEDKDSGVFGVQRYEIETNGSDNYKFGLQVTEHSDGSMDVNIILLERLDREEQGFYSLTVRAYDGDSSPRMGLIDVDVTVSDSNDNYPQFDNSTYETTVYENVPLQTTILRVHATDPDSGEFGEVVYSFAPNTPEEFRSVFGLNSTSGEIFVRGTIDYEKEKTYQLNIQAKDKGPNSLPAFTRVNINVIDLNDLAPQISVNTLTSSGVAEVLEDADIGTFVAHLSVQDPDEDGLQRFDCNIDNDHFQLVELSGSNKEYTISTNIVFDREDPTQGYEHEILLRCADLGDPPLNAIQQITVTVLDVNDHEPYFAREYYYTTIRENNSISDFIIKMQATDEDSGRNAAITYSLDPFQSGDENAVSLDPISGVIIANMVYDYEKRSNYQYTVIARDQGEGLKSGSTVLNITVLDINDEIPVFHADACDLYVVEEQDPGIFIERIFATDNDSRPFNVIKYSLDPSPSGSRDFHINESTGALFTNKRLDRENQDVYHLRVIAANEGYPVVQSTKHCTVHVLDINDNPPVIEFPNPSNNTVEISNKVPVSRRIATIVAHDPDQRPNGAIRFAVSHGNDEDYFNIDDHSGGIYVNRALEKFEFERMSLYIVVTDQGENPRAVTAELVIVIDASVVSPAASTSFLPNDTAIILGVIFGILLVVVVAAILGACIVRRRRHQMRDTNKHLSCKLGTHEALNTSPSSSNHEDMSMSDSSSNSVKDGQMSDKDVNFAFDLDTAYLQKNRRRVTEDTGSPCKCRYSDRPHPHHSDPRKELDFGQYDRSPMHRVPGKTMTSNRTRQAINRRSSDNIADRSLEQTQDVFNLSNHTDMDSECSGTDSGRGPSEEGDNIYASHAVNPYPNAHKYDSYISREPLGTPLYEVPENSSWKGSESEETEQYHGFPSQGKPMVIPNSNSRAPVSQPNSVNTQSGSRSNSIGSHRGSLPHVEPVGMYSNRDSFPQRSSTPNQSGGSGQYPTGVPKKPDLYSLPRTTVSPLKQRSIGNGECDYASPRSILYNSKLNGEDNNRPMNSNQSNDVHMSAYSKTLPVQSPPQPPPKQLDLHTSKRHEPNQQKDTNTARHAYDNYATTAMHHQKPQNAGGSESQETSFINQTQLQSSSSPHHIPHHPAIASNPVKTTAKKAVQFADDVLKRTDVSNVRAATNGFAGNNGGFTGSNSQKQDKVQMEVKVTEKPKQNPTFLEDMDCLSYSVV